MIEFSGEANLNRNVGIAVTVNGSRSFPGLSAGQLLRACNHTATGNHLAIGFPCLSVQNQVVCGNN